ncbi:MAG: enoyl-CoA hydratase/isomerase family protein [Dehalococcoidia bacterium]
MDTESLAIVERYGPRGELVLNRPSRRNALIGPLVEALRTGLAELVADPEVRVIVIRGAGGSFCAGLDLDAFAADPPPPWRAGFSALWADLHAGLYDCPKPIVGALEGPAIAAGSALALACDMLIAGDGCRFQVAEARLGLAAPINTVWLTLKFGAARALEFAVGAQPYNGPALVSRGVALMSVPDQDVLAAARGYADLLAENKPAGMAAIKSSIRMLNRIESFKDLITSVQAARPGRTAGPGDGLRLR